MYDLIEKLHFRKVFFQGKAYSGDYISKCIDDVSSYLEKKCNSHSPFVFLFARNHLKTIISYFAILQSGYSCVLIDPETKPIELEELRHHTFPCAEIVFNPHCDFFNLSEEIRTNAIEHACTSSIPPVRERSTIVYTNAESGYAKAAVLEIDNILADAEASASATKSTSSTVICPLLPFHHLFGLVSGVIAPLLSNSSLVIEDPCDLKGLKGIAEDIAKFNVTHFYSVPILFYLLSKVPRLDEQLGTIKILTSGGYKLPGSLFNRYKNKFGKELREGYGLTEAAPVCTWHHPDEDIKPESVGRSFKCCTVTIRDENNAELPPGHVGEICIKGSNVMRGYYNDAVGTRDTIKDGWLHTGDLGRMDSKGYVYITGMKKKMYNVAGRNVYPSEVKRLMMLHENVVDVQISGEAHELQGNVIKATVSLDKDGPNEQSSFKKWCLENITRFKIPRIIEFNKQQIGR